MGELKRRIWDISLLLRTWAIQIEILKPAFVALIPKRGGAKDIRDFRPVNLLKGGVVSCRFYEKQKKVSRKLLSLGVGKFWMWLMRV